MISRIQNRILQRLNIQCQRYLTNLNYEDLINLEAKDSKDKADISRQHSKVPTDYSKSKYEFTSDDDGFVSVFTDGACSRNGMKNAKAGIGVWFGEDHPLNVSQPISGRSTCTFAEIQAAIFAIKQAKKAGISKLKIHTDSNFLVLSVTDWMAKWKQSGWRKSNKKPVINKAELMELDEILSTIEVNWVHVPSHSGIHGNEKANSLARKGINNPVEESPIDT